MSDIRRSIPSSKGSTKAAWRERGYNDRVADKAASETVPREFRSDYMAGYRGAGKRLAEKALET